MRKLLFILFACLPMMMQAQKLNRAETIRTTELGNQKMVVMDSTFVLILRATPPIRIVLGTREKALQILRFLYTTETKRGDIIELENEAGDIARYNSLKQYEFATPGRDFEGQIAKRYLKGYIEVIENYGSK